MAVNSYKQDELQREVPKRVTLIRLYRYLFTYKKDIILVLGIMAVTVAIALLNPLIIERAVNVHVANRNVEGLLKLAAVALTLNVIWLVGVKIRMVIMARVSNQIVLKIREELYVHIQTLGLQFFDSRPTGKILARVIGDVNSLKDMMADSVTTLIPDAVTVAAVIAIMVVKSPWLSLAALATLPVLGVGMYVIMVRGHRRWQVVRQKNSNINAYVHENFSGIRVVQSFSAEQESSSAFDTVLEEHQNAFIRAVQLADAFGPLIDVTWGLGGFLLYYIGIRILHMGSMDVGTFLAFATYLSMFWSPIRNLANLYNRIVNNISSAERIFDILDTEPELKDTEEAYELPSIEGRVEFDHVTFAYPDEPDRDVIQDINFDIKPGETIALVGPTGAGKTTIINLISRFYDAKTGQIRIDGHPVGAVTLHSLRSQMGIMTQENFLFSGTVRENISYGKLNATEEEIVWAAKAVGAHDFIMKLEKGYDTELQGSGSLSVGQRQLLAFARTLVSQPRILILDEATSSIDTHTELMVQRGIAALLVGRTSFVIAHRLSTIKKADRIFVVDHKAILEEGTHEELLKKKGQYYNLYQAQFKNL
ncbi:MAG: ABC transporter ATP-binding protein [Lachnospiraceae bacterium]|nr:ABC transporter ATP-binding protein [Lachnospiraceae bacterium]